MTHGDWLRTSPIAHRGLHDDQIPENSLPAFEAAIAAGYGIELDVHVCADGELIVMHDEDVARMTGVDGVVAAMRAEELTRLRLLDSDATVPTLDDVLRMVAGRAPVLVEVKAGNGMDRVGAALDRLLRDYTGPVAVQSFDPRVVLWMRRHHPGIPRGQLSGSFSGVGLPGAQKAFLRSMASNAVTLPNFVAFEVDAMPSAAVSAWRRTLRVPLLLWTVRTPDQLALANRYHANVIFEHVQPPVSV